MKVGKPLKPRWIRTQWQTTPEAKRVRNSLRELGLHTVCEESDCPNRGECYNRGTCTFLIMGAICTRHCKFCDVTSGKPLCLDPDEPRHVAESIARLGIKYAVVTSVDRDDLPDFGAAHFAETIRQIREHCPGVGVEVLTPDFQGDREAIRRVLEARPDVFAHNLETVQRLTKSIRDRRAGFESSLEVLRIAAELAPDIPVKTGLMVGLGETDAEILETMRQAREAGAVSITIGQYLAPSQSHTPVDRFVEPEQFDRYAAAARDMDYEYVASAPLVRSSYRAEELSSRRTIHRDS